MFTIDPAITDLKMKDRDLFRVLFSMNVHQVANPEMSLEDARSFVFFWRESGRVKAYIGLHFIPTDRRMYYSHSSNPFPEETLADVEADARTFAEDLGAMLDELDISRLSREEKNRWIDDQEFLSGRKAPETVLEEKSEPAAAPPVPLDSVPLQPISVVPLVQPELAPMQPVEMVPPVPPQPTPIQTAPVVPPVQPPFIPMHAAPVVPPFPAAPPPVRTVQKEQPASSRPAPGKCRETGKEQSSRRKGAVRQAPVQPDNDGPEQTASVPPAGQHVDVVLEEAVKAGVVKAPKTQLKNEIRASGGIISRDKEALARLLASF